ncbi:DNA methyltransferase [Haloferax sp. Atlit-4N]|uniref:DUF1156 domain-containing protein n=1 Tax=Haloferax sp. Atlit-4N TaxID=2077206 RepID=UPI000E229F65|nr:DUF1156 domain-containing protein [Haloferax sp. Atlit-4N]RDZ49586.1 DNA methyltransferase [Haloferax sp. Atlit-4N]
MARQQPGSQGRLSLPVERGFPIERINELAEKEGRAKRHYRPIYTMHKWWARRLGCVFRSLCLYSLLDEETDVSVIDRDSNELDLGDFGGGAPMSADRIHELISAVDASNPESLWELYPEDVTIEDKRVLDPFMGGGTSIVEASRFGADVVGNDLNPVAWYVVKKEIEAGTTDVETLDEAFEQVKQEVAIELQSYYVTPCPNDGESDAHDHEHDHDHGHDHDQEQEHDGHLADVMHYLWVKELECVSCGEDVPLFSDYRVAKGRYDHTDEYNVFCPNCERLTYVDDWRSQSTCDHCSHEFVPEDGNVSRGKYSCTSCGQQYGITDAIEELGGYDQRLYAVEYYCSTCDDRGEPRHEIKGYRAPTAFDLKQFNEAKQEWESSPELDAYVPQEPIPEGAITKASSISGNDVFQHGYSEWTDMFNERQLLVLSKLLRAIDTIDDQNAKEYLLLAFSDMLRFNNQMIGYQASRNHLNDLFQTNSFAPQTRPAEANPWGTKYGMGNFQKNWEMVRDGVAYANAPTERYMEAGEILESEPFTTPIGQNVELSRGDMRRLGFENEFDAVITDPPYYDNIIYSEVADYFYVWQKLLLEGKYDGFDQEQTPRVESIVTNPHLGKTTEDFESELHEAFTVIHQALKDDGVLTFTYHHSDSESWGELLASLCDVGFEVTATYPISADVKKFITGEAVSFDIIVVARPIEQSDISPISWPRLKRSIYSTAQDTRRKLAADRDLSRGDIGVMEMGACFHEYSKHHGKVQRDGEIMDAKEVVNEIYGIIQEASQIGTTDVFVDLLAEDTPTYDSVNKLCRGTNAKPEELKQLRLFSTEDGFELGTWQNERRIAYIEDRINAESELTALDKLQYLRRRYEDGKTLQNYIDKWGVDDEVRDLSKRLADATGDEAYRRVLGDRDISSF